MSDFYLNVDIKCSSILIIYDNEQTTIELTVYSYILELFLIRYQKTFKCIYHNIFFIVTGRGRRSKSSAMEQSYWVFVVMRSNVRWTWKHLAVPIRSLWEWWRSFPYPLHIGADVRRQTSLLYGALSGTIFLLWFC